MMVVAQRLLDIPFVRRSDALRTFIVSAWLGWQIESNWADPFLFTIYAVARPIAAVSILVVMYSVITSGAVHEPIFAYIFLGNALYILVAQIAGGVSFAVTDDREHYRTMKQLYTTPMNGLTYLLGRGMARLLTGSASVIITVVFGVLLFQLPLSFAGVDWPMFIASMVVGVTAIACIGLILGAATLSLPRHSWNPAEAITGALFLFTGAIFPLDTLPIWLRPVGFIFPVTYWLELTRRALLGPNAARFPTLAGFSDVALLGILAAMTVVVAAIAIVYYRWAMRQALLKGLIDMETSF
jgi:ABC-2 type transport system permease protein